MIYAVTFLGVGVVLILRGMMLGGWWYSLLWPGVALVVVGSAYAGVGPHAFAKRADGSRRWWAQIVLMPYLAMTQIAFHIQRLPRNRPDVSEIVPGVYLGRFPMRGDVPADVGMVVDLTCEFALRAAGRGQIAYENLPTLDAATPPDDAFVALARRVAAYSKPVYIHCALGRGRSASLVAAVLIARSVVMDVETAEALIRQRRPGVRLNRSQRNQIQRLTSRLKAKAD